MTGRPSPAARPLYVWATATVAAGVAVLALALVLGGGAPPAPPPGVADDSRIPAWTGEIVGYLALVAGVVAVGLGALRVTAEAMAASAAWCALSVLQLGVLAWELAGRADVFAAPVGQALMAQAALAFVAACGWAVGAAAPGRSLALPAALAGMLPVVLAGHPRSAEHRWVASVSVSVHVLAAAVWIGGLLALAWLAVSRRDWRSQLPRYSTVATGCVAALAVSGVVAALGRVGLGDLMASKYGALVVLKAVALLGLATAGWFQRQYVVRRTSTATRPFLALAAFELTTMALTMALAAALSRTPPPA